MTVASPETGTGALPNIGPTIARRLAAIGIHTRGDLERMGPSRAYVRLCAVEERRLPMCYNLYSLAAALDGVDWRDLTPEVKLALRNEADIASSRG
jgi:DNA transformation protein